LPLVASRPIGRLIQLGAFALYRLAAILAQYNSPGMTNSTVTITITSCSMSTPVSGSSEAPSRRYLFRTKTGSCLGSPSLDRQDTPLKSGTPPAGQAEPFRRLHERQALACDDKSVAPICLKWRMRQWLSSKSEREKIDRRNDDNDEGEHGFDEHDSRRVLEPRVEQDEQECPQSEEQAHEPRDAPPSLNEEHTRPVRGISGH